MTILVLGLALTASSWLLAWSHIPELSEFTFFPLWIGYILSINGLSEVLFDTSLLRILRGRFISLFIISIPMWWLFESLNSITRNWEYILPHPISNIQYIVEASIDFSTVIPAVLSSAFLMYKCLDSVHYYFRSKPFIVTKSHLVIYVLFGIFSFAVLPLFPNETFPLIWVAPILLLEPVLYATGSPSWLRTIERGQYLLLVSTAAGTIFNGFWWELWNFHSLPKWVYHIPYVGFARIFEMPILGYLGYPFFGVFLFSYSACLMYVVFKVDLPFIFRKPRDPVTLPLRIRCKSG